MQINLQNDNSVLKALKNITQSTQRIKRENAEKNFASSATSLRALCDNMFCRLLTNTPRQRNFIQIWLLMY
jgi:hypothetical protein